MQQTEFHPGEQLHGFNVLRKEVIEELNLTLIQLQHDATGARWVHLQNSDSNNLFAVGFRTPPADSTGIAHILEHTALCGSRHYPVRDPFFSMLKRSLNTFMNAMTSSDWTLYPFSSQNLKDFKNLRNIYLDAAFFPLLREQDFLQEGHRLEFSNVNDPSSPLEFKGVVYNEMKGAMASPSSLLYRRMGAALYPTTCYRFNSGGEPSDIPDLTWQSLRDFHARYYHPSNAWFYSYGDIPLAEHLETAADKVMQHFSRLEIDSVIPSEHKTGEPTRRTEYFPIDPGEETARKSIVQTAWLTCDIEESFDRLALNLLSTLLLGNPAAPLHNALINSKLGGNLAPGSGFQDENRTTYFAAGLQATDPEKSEEIERLILDTLETVSRNGFEQERIAGAIHRLEFSQREVTGDRYPYALGLLMKMMGPWLHADDPVSVLKLDQNLNRLRDETLDKSFFPELIKRYLIDNRHRVTLTLAPDPALQERLDRETATRLNRIADTLTVEEKEQIIASAAELKESQEQEEDLSCLPSLEISDIPEKEEETDWEERASLNTPVEWFDQPTNGIGYFNAYLPINSIPPELVPYLPLYCSLATQVGAAGYSYTEMAERIEAHTGGISLSSEILNDPDQPDRFQALVSIRGKALNSKQEQLFAILSDVINAADFNDIDRIRTVLLQIQTSFENSIPGSGHLFAARAGAAKLSPASALREQWTGISLLHLIRRLTALDDDSLKAEAEKFGLIATYLINRARMTCAITAEEKTFDTTTPHLESFLAKLPSVANGAAKTTAAQTVTTGRFGWATSVPVSYVTRTFRTIPFSHSDAAHLLVLAKLLRAGYLHREIREKGGAYGGMASCNIESGLFSLLSYRDPHLARTLATFSDAAKWAANGSFSEESIKETQISVFADLDRPLSPGSRGSHQFANNRQGMTLEKRQTLRQRVLATSRDDLIRVARTYLVDNRQMVDSIISNEELLQKAKSGLKEEMIIKRI